MDKMSKPFFPSPKHVNLTAPKLPQDLERDGTSLNYRLNYRLLLPVWFVEGMPKKNNLMTRPGLDIERFGL